MLLSAELLTTFQRCKRRYALEREWKVNRWRPRDLYQALLREAVFAISNGADATATANEACTRFLETAAKPGLDILTDPYTIARDWCAILQTSLEAISRLVLLTLERGPLVLIGDHKWQTTAFRDESGVLHSWFAVERWDEDTQYQKLHSWEVFGDCAANNVGMQLHVVEVGRATKGHQHTPWARIFAHPVLPGHHRFQKLEGGKLEGSWKPKWYQDSDKNTASEWVDLMERDQLELVRHVAVREPAGGHVERFQRDAVRLAGRMERMAEMCSPVTGRLVADWEDEIMERPQCDIPPCPWQDVCYSPSGVTNIEVFGLYSRRG